MCCIRIIGQYLYNIRMNSVLVYNGNGTKYVDFICNLLKDQLNNKFLVQKVSSQELQSRNWMFSTKVLVIPGGRDLPYTRDITMSAIDNIREFVDMGGSYLGICAGAYFACSQVEFEKGTSLEVLGYRSLQFFKGIARGSVYNGFKYDSTSGARMVRLQLHHDFKAVNQNSYAYFDGGCEFVPEDNFTLHKTVAFYNDFNDKKAIVLTKFGKGKVLLSGVHPEMDVNFLKDSDYTSSQWIELMKYSHFQKELFCLFINILFDRCNEF